jgi:hypothetical protein
LDTLPSTLRRRDSFGALTSQTDKPSSAMNEADDVRSTAMTAGGTKALSRSLAACVLALPGLALGVGSAQAKNGDTHITGIGVEQTLDCNESTLIVNGNGNTVTALGSCWAVTVQGSSNTIIADNVVNDITVYGYDQVVFYKTGDPVVWDRGRELGMMNRIDRVPA